MSSPAGYRLSPQQARRWARDGGAGHVRVAVQVEGVLDRARLARAIEDVFARHEALRTTYRRVPGTNVALQVPLAPQAIELATLDATTGAAGAPEPSVEELLDGWQTAETGYTAAFQVALAALGPASHLLLIELPALSSDRRGLVNLVRLIADAWSASDATNASTIQYPDVAGLFNELLESSDGEAGRRYWSRLTLAPAVDAAGGGGGRSASTPIALDAETLAALQAAAAGAGIDPSMFVLAAWRALLHRLSEEDTGPIAVTVDGRTYEGLDSIPGLFERRVPLAVPVDPRAGILTLARAASAALEEAAQWQDYFDLETALAGRGAVSGGAGFRVGFDAFSDPDAFDAGNLKLRIVGLRAAPDLVGLEPAFLRRGNEISLALRWDPRRHDTEEAARIGERLACLLDAGVREPALPIADLPLLGPSERARLAAWNRTARTWPIDDNVGDAFEAQARRTPERQAVVFNDERLSFAELSARSSRLAHHLLALGVGPEQRVGLYLERGIQLLVAVLGVLKAGAAYVPLDPMAPLDRLADTLAQADARVVIVDETRRRDVPAGHGLRVVSLDGEDAAAIAARPETPPPVRVHPDHLVYVIFTSGSTGRPKGAMIQHRSVLNLLGALREAVYAPLAGRALRVGMNAPIAFDASVKQWIQLLDGHTIVIVPEEARPSPERLCEIVRRQALDVLDCTPSQLAGALTYGLGHDEDCSPGLVLVGGEAMPAATWQATAARAARTTFVNVYGPTECTVDATACATRASLTPTIGGPLGNVRVHVLDATLRPAPIGVIGELCIGGAGVGRGYCDQPALTAERFIPDPFGDEGARLYRTGDLVRMRDDGRIEFIGRADGQAKIRGFRIELGEVEAALAGQPGVRRAVAVVREISPGETHVVAYVVRAADGGPPAPFLAALRAALRRTLPEYMVPWAIVPLPALPLTPNGKLDRAALPDPRATAGDELPYEAPASEIERAIAGIWQEVLNRPRVGLHQNFFDLGGHSLLMVRVHERLIDAFGRRLSIVELFRHPTVAALARHIAEARETGEDAPEATAAAGPDPSDRARRQRQAIEQQAIRNRQGRRGR